MTIFNVSNFKKKTNQFFKSFQGDEGNIQLALNNSSHSIEIARFDTEQRYTFIYSSKLGFVINDLLTKRDDEIELNDGRIKLRKLKKQVIENGTSEIAIISFPDAAGKLTYHISINPVYNDLENVIGGTSVSVDISDIKNTFINSKTLKGILSLCSYCKSIRNDKGEWEEIDSYIYHNSEAQISHGICPDCMKKISFQGDPTFVRNN